MNNRFDRVCFLRPLPKYDQFGQYYNAQEHPVEAVQVGYAKTHLSALLGRVEQGVEVTIARRGKAVAKLVPVSTRTAAQAFEEAIALGGLDLPTDVSDTTGLLPPDDINLD